MWYSAFILIYFCWFFFVFPFSWWWYNILSPSSCSDVSMLVPCLLLWPKGKVTLWYHFHCETIWIIKKGSKEGWCSFRSWMYDTSIRKSLHKSIGCPLSLCTLATWRPVWATDLVNQLSIVLCPNPAFILPDESVLVEMNRLILLPNLAPPSLGPLNITSSLQFSVFWALESMQLLSRVPHHLRILVLPLILVIYVYSIINTNGMWLVVKVAARWN